MISKMTSAELREAIAEIAARVNDPHRYAYYHIGADPKFGDCTEHTDQAQDDLIFLLDLIDQLSPDCYQLTEAGREVIGAPR